MQCICREEKSAFPRHAEPCCCASTEADTHQQDDQVPGLPERNQQIQADWLLERRFYSVHALVLFCPRAYHVCTHSCVHARPVAISEHRASTADQNKAEEDCRAEAAEQTTAEEHVGMRVNLHSPESA